jgi:hypothetical protein
VTLHDALTPAEKPLVWSPDGAAKVQEFHRRLFASSIEEMRQEIARVTLTVENTRVTRELGERDLVSLAIAVV